MRHHDDHATQDPRRRFPWRTVAVTLAAIGFLFVSPTQTTLPPQPLGAASTTFTGISYYGLLAVSKDVRDADLPWMKNKGFNLVRVWATWSGPSATGTGPGTLVAWDGDLKSDQAVALLAVLKDAKSRNSRVDLSFDLQEFKKICQKAKKTAKYQNYKVGITKVAKFVSGKSENPLQTENFSSFVVMDICNEAFASQQDLSDTTYDNTQFTDLSFEGETKKPWWAILQDLLDIPRQSPYKIRSFFSAVGVGHADPSVTDPSNDELDKAAVEKFAGYAKKVYTPPRFSQDPKVLVAPHFDRSPCPDGWGARTSTRIGWIKAKEVLLGALDIYVQEENRRGAGQCCNRPCGDASPRPMDVEVIGCSGWGKTCAHPECDPTKKGFKDSFQQAQGKAWGWVFHTDAGLGCDTEKRITDNLDDVEVTVVSGLPIW